LTTKIREPKLQGNDFGLTDAADLLAVMMDGNRLKDIPDLPLDLAV